MVTFCHRDLLFLLISGLEARGQLAVYEWRQSLDRRLGWRARGGDGRVHDNLSLIYKWANTKA